MPISSGFTSDIPTLVALKKQSISQNLATIKFVDDAHPQQQKPVIEIHQGGHHVKDSAIVERSSNAGLPSNLKRKPSQGSSLTTVKFYDQQSPPPPAPIIEIHTPTRKERPPPLYIEKSADNPILERQIYERPLHEKPSASFGRFYNEKPPAQPVRVTRFERYRGSSKGKCCKSVYDTDEFQCCDCCNGRCPSSLAFLGSMCACPAWMWILGLLGILGLVIAVICLGVTAGTTVSVRTIYQYITGTSTSVTERNLTVNVYYEGPCTDPSMNLTNYSTIYRLCNVTTTRIATVVYQNQVNNQVLNNPVVINSEASRLEVIFSLLLYSSFSALFTY